jgi:hypothetical protein
VRIASPPNLEIQKDESVGIELKEGRGGIEYKEYCEGAVASNTYVPVHHQLKGRKGKEEE